MAYLRNTLVCRRFIINSNEPRIKGYVTYAHWSNEDEDRSCHNHLSLTIEEIKEKLIQAYGSGIRIVVTFFNGSGFDRITGMIEGINLNERFVNIVFYGKRWNIKIYDIVEIEEFL